MLIVQLIYLFDLFVKYYGHVVCVYHVWWYRRKVQKYKSLAVRDTAAVYTELVDNHKASAPQPRKSLLT